MTNQKKSKIQVKRQSLCVRLSPSRREAVGVLAEKEEKTITRVIEEAIDYYVKPKIHNM